MTSLDIPIELQEFVRRYVDSVELIMILDLLRSQPGRVWSIAAINDELRSTEYSIRNRMRDLYHRGVLKPGPDASADQHRFIPADEAMRQNISLLLDLYRSRPHRVFELIYSRPNQALQALSDAF